MHGQNLAPTLTSSHSQLIFHSLTALSAKIELLPEVSAQTHLYFQSFLEKPYISIHSFYIFFSFWPNHAFPFPFSLSLSLLHSSGSKYSLFLSEAFLSLFSFNFLFFSLSFLFSVSLSPFYFLLIIIFNFKFVFCISLQRVDRNCVLHLCFAFLFSSATKESRRRRRWLGIAFNLKQQLEQSCWWQRCEQSLTGGTRSRMGG
ncbi:hypothetical protein RIF29_22090 [Crotalaria pallida]|uniref:Transmembrane protein n=1 Tax=Crotalaria pallida TaxID=3830 RepID=A0AAN9IA23_CROPI